MLKKMRIEENPLDELAETIKINSIKLNNDLKNANERINNGSNSKRR
jgi:SepF-like predicted cell division protein (DUF552 family)